MLQKRKSEESMEDSTKKVVSGSFDDIRNDSPMALECVNSIRALACMLPQQANSGHPGAPMGCAVMAYVLWGHAMKYSPINPKWWNRDRFVLSNGHACALQYTLLHLTGYELSLEDLKHFRQLHSKCPGHPEVICTKGVEVCTGPLGQGISNAVGLAMAAHNMIATYNTEDFELFNNYIYCICGDGCLQEGISSEASSLAGCNGLGRLICLYDSNGIQIDGSTKTSFTEDVAKRYEAYGWDVQTVSDGDHDIQGVHHAIQHAKSVLDKPSLIIVKTTIGFGSMQQGSHKCHGSPLGLDDVKAFRAKLGFSDDLWDIPETARDFFKNAGLKGVDHEKSWDLKFAEYSKRYPEKAAELARRFAHKLPEGYKTWMPTYKPEDPPKSTRDLSEICLNAVYSHLPELIGGSADLTGSNKTALKGEPDFSRDNQKARYVRFGVREHAMCAISNGLFAYGSYRPFCATFLNFYTYAWGACRLEALSRFGILNIASHDSIELGEDGPTHQPIETIALIRATPNAILLRPCDGNEVCGSYNVWLERHESPVFLCLSRDKLPHLSNTNAEKVFLGGYVLSAFSNSGKPKALLAGSGTETQHAVKAAELLKDEFDCQVVSMPSWELFAAQPEDYRESVIPTVCKFDKNAIAAYIEAASTYGFARYFNEEACVGMTTFGESAPAKVNQLHFGFTAENFANRIREGFQKKQNRPFS